MYLDLSARMCHGIFFAGGQPHEFGTERLMRQCLASDSVFVDVGANVGYYSLLASSILQRGRIIAIEPQPAAVRILRKNAELADGRIEVYAVAASDSQGEAEFYVRSSGDTSSFERSEGASKVVVNQIALDELLRDLNRIDLIKIDVEGFEARVLSGAVRILDACRPLVYFEVLQDKVRAGVASLEAIFELLRAHDYDVRWINHSRHGALIQDSPSTYAVGVPSEKLEWFMHVAVQGKG